MSRYEVGVLGRLVLDVEADDQDSAIAIVIEQLPTSFLVDDVEVIAEDE